MHIFLSGDNGLGVALALIGAGAWAYYSALGSYKVKKTIEYLPTSKAIAVAPGTVEVAGIAKSAGSTFASPFEQKECLYYKTNVFKWSGSGKHRRRTFVKSMESSEPFYLEDDTGKVLVMPSIEVSPGLTELVGLDKKLSRAPKAGFLSNLFSSDKDTRLVPFLAEHVPDLSNYGDIVDVEERFIAQGDSIFMVGDASEKETGGKVQMLVGRKKGSPYCIADGDEKRALRDIGAITWLFLLLGPLSIAAGLAIATVELANSFFLEFMMVLLIILYSYVFLVSSLEFYNGLILLRNNIRRANANVDALLARRSSLIPNLVQVVSEAAKHERSVMDEIAALRTSGVADSKQLFAIAEGYPSLQANQNFLSLQKEISNTENWIAGARSYVADSIMLYNSRVQSFPYFLFAPSLGLHPIQQGEMQPKTA